MRYPEVHLGQLISSSIRYIEYYNNNERHVIAYKGEDSTYYIKYTNRISDYFNAMREVMFIKEYPTGHVFKAKGYIKGITLEALSSLNRVDIVTNTNWELVSLKVRFTESKTVFSSKWYLPQGLQIGDIEVM